VRNSTWLFGKNGGIRFNPGPTVFSNLPISTYEGCASICGPTGNLILYSDGVRVWDGAGTVRITGLAGNSSSTQSALILPDPGNPKRYYLFTSDGASGGNNHVRGVRINVTNWAATPLSALLAAPIGGYSPTEKLIAVRHANKKDFWVLTVVQQNSAGPADIGPGVLRVFKLTAAGVTWVGDQLLNHDVADVGYMKSSRDGLHLAIANLWLRNVLLMTFSNATGQINPSTVTILPVTVPPFNTGGYVYGVEFSPSGRLLYYSTLFPLPIAASPTSNGYVFQYLIANGTLTLIGSHNNDKAGDVALGALQLGPDGRIYVAQDGEKALGVIASPDIPGPGCNLTFSAVSLHAGSTCNAGLPNLVRDLF
jgi:hypothetical protein